MSVYVPITASDTTVYAPALKSVWVSVAGNVAILGYGDTVPQTLTNVPVGFLNFPYPVQKIMLTNTTATVVTGCATG